MRDALSSLSQPFSVLALLSVGLQINFYGSKPNRIALLTGLGYKLLVAPLLVFIVYVLLLKQHGWQTQACILGSAIGPMNTAAVLARQYNLNPDLAAQMIGLGIPLSFCSLYLLHCFL